MRWLHRVFLVWKCGNLGIHRLCTCRHEEMEIQPVIHKRSSCYVPAEMDNILVTMHNLPRYNYCISDPLCIARYPFKYTNANSQTTSHNNLFLPSSLENIFWPDLLGLYSLLFSNAHQDYFLKGRCILQNEKNLHYQMRWGAGGKPSLLSLHTGHPWIFRNCFEEYNLTACLFHTSLSSELLLTAENTVL